MTEPTTVNVALIVPATGDLPGAWGTAALNPNFQAIDGLFAGKTTIALSSATTLALTLPAGSLTPGGGPNQSQNAVIKLTGTLTGNSVIQFGMPGRYIIDNSCVVASFYVQLSPASGTGNVIAAPPGRKCYVFFDGTDMDYVDMPEVGSYMDLCVPTVPAWINACTNPPYLPANGTLHSVTQFPALGAMLGSTFGGNGITTFGTPDQQNRVRIPLGGGRVTPLSGINGTTWGAAGGSELMQNHVHSIPMEGGSVLALPFTLGDASFASQGLSGGSASTDLNTHSTGLGNAQNMQPTLVHGLTFIKT